MLNHKMEEVTGRQKLAQQELRALDEDEDQERNAVAALTNLEAFCHTVAAGLDVMTFEERQQFLRLLVNFAKMESKDHIRIELAIPHGSSSAVLDCVLRVRVQLLLRIYLNAFLTALVAA